MMDTALNSRTYTAEGYYAPVYTDFTSEELYGLATDGDETALWTLCRKYEPLFKSEAKLYRRKMADAYDTEDFISIGYILVWDITKKQNFSETIDGGKVLGDEFWSAATTGCNAAG